MFRSRPPPAEALFPVGAPPDECRLLESEPGATTAHTSSLAALIGGNRTDGGGLAIVVAHPDDETLGCGAVLANLRGAHLVLVTDGASRDLADARRCGFDSAEAYAAARKRELIAALRIGRCRLRSLLLLGYPDQQAAHHLASLARRLAELFEQYDIDTALTHAYEGGHPDHDATAFGVHRAALLVGEAGRRLRVIEMPFYSLGPAGIVRQRFACDGPAEIRIALSASVQRRKRRMIAAHGTQRATLAPFHVRAERFREAPRYDFGALPNGGRLLYEAYPWGLTGADWVRMARAADETLRLAQR